MSCDGNRGKHFAHVAQHQAVQDAFGSAADAEAGLEQIFNTARAQARPGNATLRANAEARTRKLFDEMRSLGIKPPTHSPSGLPRKDAQFGYAAVHQTLSAIRSGTRLPGLARQVVEQRQHTRRISAVREDDNGYFRCGNCGRFASRTRAHVCPATATRQTLEGHLRRRLGVPETAYGEGLESVLAEARTSGVVRMRHGLTGEVIEASLDGLPLALTTGFVPEAWTGQTALVELPGGRVVGVLNPDGLQQIHPGGNAVADAGAAYGLAIQPGAPVGSATSTPSMPYHSITSSAVTSVSGGQAYDLGHFIGTEFRKRDARGTDIDVNGVCYTVGDRSQDPDDWSSARRTGIEPPPKGGVAVGRTLVEAVGILARGEVVETADGAIQVYDADRENLLAVYDPTTNTAGDTDGTPNASAAQMAAVLAQRALHPQNEYDLALATDLVRASKGSGSALAAADSGYITLKDFLSGGKTLTLGASVSTQRCPNCGQFMGDAHACPAGSGTAAPQPTPDTSSPAPRFEAPSLTFQPQIDVQVDTSPIADALKNAPPTQVQVDTRLDADAFAQAVQKGLGGVNISSTTPQDLAELRQAMTQMAQAVESLARNGGAREVRIPERLVEVTERLAASVAGAGIAPAVADRSPGATRCPKCGQFADENHTCPPRQPRTGRPVSSPERMSAQEHILAPVTLPAPDPYLLQVPENVGGQLQQPLAEFIPTVDPNFEINEQGERILRSMSATMQLGAGKDKSTWTRSFGLYGPPGTGKNTIARQLAASIKTVDADGNVSQGMNYTEANITPESSMQELIGTTVLEKDPETGATVSRTKLGKIGLAAAMGSVICVNEIVRNPKLATALQSMIEDGEIQVDSPEQGLIRIPVHPSTVFVMTWNPGYEGDAERPGQAPLSRIMPLRMDRPSADEQARRVESFFAGVRGEAAEVDSIGARRREITAQDYAVPASIAPTKEEITASVRFFNEIGALTGGGIGERQVGLNSDTSTAPGQRELNRFVALGKTIGWNDALETLKIVCDQDDQFDSQWALIRERFEVHFGVDGNALTRSAPAQN